MKQACARIAMGILLLAGLAGPGAVSAQGGENEEAGRHWPMFRHDFHLTGRSPLQLELATAPSVQWKHDLGAERVAVETVTLEDFDGDREHEALIRTNNSLKLLDSDGSVLWEHAGLANPKVINQVDYAENGSLGIVYSASDGVKTTYSIIDSVSGTKTELFSMQNVFGLNMRHGKILPEIKGRQLVVFWSGDPVQGSIHPGQGYIWSFEEGCDKPKLLFDKYVEGYILSPLLAFEDFNRDGKPDLYIVTHEHVYVWDILSGETLFEGYWNDDFIRNYWANLAVYRFPGREYPSLLMINPMLPGAYVVDLVGEAPVRRWKQVIGANENQYQTVVEVANGAPDPFVDLDGDGEPEILVRAKNEHLEDEEHLVIFNAEDGERIYDGPMVNILAVDELDGAAPPEVILNKETGLEIAHWTGEAFETVWTDGEAQPVLAPVDALQDPLRFVATRPQFTNPVVWKSDAAEHAFYLRYADGVWSAKLTEGGAVEKIAPADPEHPATGFVPEGERMRTTVESAEGVHRILRDGATVGEIAVTRERSFLSPPSIVGELGGQTRIVARTADSRLVSLDAAGGDERTLVRQTPASGGVHLHTTFIGTIVDVDGDGENELLTTTAEQGRAVVAVDAAGQEKLRLTAGDDPGEMVLVATGKLAGKPGNWITIRWQEGEKTWGVPWTVATYDATDGRLLWERTTYGLYGGKPSTFGIHVPTSVADYNGDGGDDLFVASENFFGIIDATTGEDLLAAKNILDQRADKIWPAYSKLLLVEMDGQAPLELVHSHAFAATYVATWESEPLWSVKLTRDTTAAHYPGVVDLDGNGVKELVTSQVDGLLIAYNHVAAGEAASERWRFSLPGRVSDLAVVNLDSDGQEELLAGAADGKLYALKEADGQCQVLWTVDLGSPVGSPIVAELGEAGSASILVPTQDGYLYCLR